MSEGNMTPLSCSYSPCGCLGYGYVPVQEFSCAYGAVEALEKGSLFPELNLSINEYGKICKHCGGYCDE